jgi:hypothetical protein
LAEIVLDHINALLHGVGVHLSGPYKTFPQTGGSFQIYKGLNRTLRLPFHDHEKDGIGSNINGRISVRLSPLHWFVSSVKGVDFPVIPYDSFGLGSDS